jgi:hypothetical protein
MTTQVDMHQIQPGVRLALRAEALGRVYPDVAGEGAQDAGRTSSAISVQIERIESHAERELAIDLNQAGACFFLLI